MNPRTCPSSSHLGLLSWIGACRLWHEGTTQGQELMVLHTLGNDRRCAQRLDLGPSCLASAPWKKRPLRNSCNSTSSFCRVSQRRTKQANEWDPLSWLSTLAEHRDLCWSCLGSSTAMTADWGKTFRPMTIVEVLQKKVDGKFTLLHELLRRYKCRLVLVESIQHINHLCYVQIRPL